MTVRPDIPYSLPSIVLGAIFIVLGAILTPNMTFRPGTPYFLQSIVLRAIFIFFGDIWIARGAIMTPNIKLQTPHRKKDTRSPAPYGATCLIRKRPPPRTTIGPWS